MGTHDCFAALPERALADARLTAVHFRVLGVIALHDRRSGPRQEAEGCWASHQTMASEIRQAASHFSAAAKELAIWGYLTRDRHHSDQRRWVYRVIYKEGECYVCPELSRSAYWLGCRDLARHSWDEPLPIFALMVAEVFDAPVLYRPTARAAKLLKTRRLRPRHQKEKRQRALSRDCLDQPSARAGSRTGETR
jgi:hypothetical protein